MKKRGKSVVLEDLKWAGKNVGKGMLTGLGTLLTYALAALIIIQYSGLSWLRNAFGMRFTNSDTTQPASQGSTHQTISEFVASPTSTK
jgi:hypothetical protein